MNANIVTTTTSKRPNTISAPIPSALPVLAFLTNEVLFRNALRPVVMAAIAANKEAKIK